MRRARGFAPRAPAEVLLRPVYGAAVRLLHAMAAVAPPGESKLSRALRARRGLIVSYQEWGRVGRDKTRPLLWVHAPSVGEGLQAQPIMGLVRERRPDVQLAYTFFSPSAEPFAAGISADFRAYLPFDHPRDCAAALAALEPTALVFCKSDVWPNLVEAADERGVALGLMSATLPAGSARMRPPVSTLLRSAFARLDRVGAIDQSDADRLRQLGVEADRLTVTGDTRFDQVWARAALPPGPLVTRLKSDLVTVVAGSTWPSDEEVLLRAIHTARSRVRLRLIIAPHEVTRSRLHALEPTLRRGGATVARLSEDASAGADTVVVDSYGILGDLYRLADIAYVGGAFHRAGLHSVLEPAAFGVPVIFGPHHSKSREAALLLQGGGARAVSTRTELESALSGWSENGERRRAAGAAARQVVEAGLGAAERSYELVTELLERIPASARLR